MIHLTQVIQGMTQVDVYGIGNALVDLEFEVDESFLAEAGIDKGLMTLIDAEPQDRLLHALQQRTALRKRAGGGSAANTLYALSRFGGRSFYSCKVANDEPGDFYINELGNHNVLTNLAADREAGQTGRCVVMITPDAERTMLTNLGISQSVSTQDLKLDIAAEAKFVYVEGYLVTSDSARQAALQLKDHARANGVRTAMTFSDPSIVQHFRAGMEEVVGEGVDLLFCNEREAYAWTGESTLDAAARKLEGVARQFALTRGAQGARLFDGEKYVDIAPHAVEAVDCNGAGDMFAGAFLYGLTHGMSFEQAGKLASLASATVVANFGPRLTPEQHTELLSSFLASGELAPEGLESGS